MIVVEASKFRTCTCKGTGTFQAQVAAGANLCTVSTYNTSFASQFYVHVNTGDSMSWTSLSTWIRMLTVMSNSPLYQMLDYTSVKFSSLLLTKSEANCTPAHRLELAGIKKRLPQHYGTSI